VTRGIQIRFARIGPVAAVGEPSAPDPATRSTRWTWVWAWIKRTLDIVGSLMLLSATLPLLLVIAVAIKLDSPGPVFYRVRRVGYRGRPLHMLKFRKMHREASGAPLTADGDRRLTRVGSVLHRSRLDELPQFWDVLRGRMSLVGPRPEDPTFVALHLDAYDRILSVRPGITGISQLAFAEEHKILNEHDAIGDYVRRILPQKVALDIKYADMSRMRLDLAVMLWTLVAMLAKRPVAVHRSTLEMGLRRRPRPINTVEIAPVAERAPVAVLAATADAVPRQQAAA
jgi:lipopolysaccharide/colanic/teichoic acid biosynthesis glycosyltransferase